MRLDSYMTKLFATLRKKISASSIDRLTLANPTRLATLENLLDGPMNVSEISKNLEQEQSMISHNLRSLVRCGFVKVERKCKERVYPLNWETVGALFNVVENHAQKFCPTKGRCKLVER